MGLTARQDNDLLLMMASCQFKKQSESRQLSAGAGRVIRAFLIKDRAKL